MICKRLSLLPSGRENSISASELGWADPSLGIISLGPPYGLSELTPFPLKCGSLA